MVSPQSREVLHTLKNSAHGRALIELIEDHLRTLDDVSTIKSWDEALGRQHAKILIKDIFSFLEIKPAVDKLPNQYT